jgi:hypothetical protein
VMALWWARAHFHFSVLDYRILLHSFVMALWRSRTHCHFSALWTRTKRLFYAVQAPRAPYFESASSMNGLTRSFCWKLLPLITTVKFAGMYLEVIMFHAVTANHGNSLGMDCMYEPNNQIATL